MWWMVTNRREPLRGIAPDQSTVPWVMSSGGLWMPAEAVPEQLPPALRFTLLTAGYEEVFGGRSTVDAVVAGADRQLLRRPRSQHGSARLPQGKAGAGIRRRPERGGSTDSGRSGVVILWKSCRQIVAGRLGSDDRIGNRTEGQTRRQLNPRMKTVRQPLNNRISTRKKLSQTKAPPVKVSISQG